MLPIALTIFYIDKWNFCTVLLPTGFEYTCFKSSFSKSCSSTSTTQTSRKRNYIVIFWQTCWHVSCSWCQIIFTCTMLCQDEALKDSSVYLKNCWRNRQYKFLPLICWKVPPRRPTPLWEYHCCCNFHILGESHWLNVYFVLSCLKLNWAANTNACNAVLFHERSDLLINTMSLRL